MNVTRIKEYSSTLCIVSLYICNVEGFDRNRCHVSDELSSWLETQMAKLGQPTNPLTFSECSAILPSLGICPSYMSPGTSTYTTEPFTTAQTLMNIVASLNGAKAIVIVKRDVETFTQTTMIINISN